MSSTRRTNSQPTGPFRFSSRPRSAPRSTGVWQVRDARQRDAVLLQLEQHNAVAEGLLVQAAVTGALERTQSVFDRGRLVALHIYRQVAEGPGGGDVLKISVVSAVVRENRRADRAGAGVARRAVVRLHPGRCNRTPHFIDANPRLVEPMNAWLSGVDLPVHCCLYRSARHRRHSPTAARASSPGSA